VPNGREKDCRSNVACGGFEKEKKLPDREAGKVRFVIG
jgi:hypothetical protein